MRFALPPAAVRLAACLLLSTLSVLPQWTLVRAASHAPQAHEARSRLSTVNGRIRTVTRQKRRETRERAQLSAQLSSAERALNAARARLADTSQRIAAQEAKRQALAAERKQAAARLAQARSALAAEVRAAYELDREGPLKLLLNQRDPLQSERRLRYAGYFGRAIAARVASVDAQLQQLDGLDRQLAAQGQQLAELAARRKAQLQTLSQAQDRRRQSLAALKARLATRDEQLAQLQQQRADLERLLKRLQRPAPHPGPAGHGAFARQRGRLDWPVSGRLLAQFGEPRASGQPWDGMLIGTRRGAPVHAVGGGRVVYADWLPGLGLLMIIDHGDGYLSLYGHNERLFKAVGQSVAAGDTIAAAGDTGGRADPQLYFEIRHNGQPVDPRPWFRTRRPPTG